MMTMTRILCAALVAASAFAGGASATEAPERIVFVRHGEKPPEGLGQLDCKGLNRALALPAFFEKSFGRPDAIFAPNPSVAKKDDGKLYDYVRPLATIEPTAIAFGMPVQVDIGYEDVAGLRKALEAPRYKGSLILVAWEHKQIDVVVRDILTAHGADSGQVPDWKYTDYDSVDIVTLDASGHAAFERRKEGLDGQSETCPR